MSSQTTNVWRSAPIQRLGQLAGITLLALTAGACSSGGGQADQSGGAGSGGQAPGLIVAGDTTVFTVKGPEGGPFPEGSRTYSLVNSSPTRTIRWNSEASAPWLLFSEQGGLLGPGAVQDVTVTLDGQLASSLPHGDFPADIIFRDAHPEAGDGLIYLAFLLRVIPGPEDSNLWVSPESTIQVSGDLDGNLSQDEVVYSLQNLSRKPLSWTLSTDQSWLVLPDDWSGALEPGEEGQVVLDLDGPVTSSLGEGQHLGTVHFTVTSGPKESTLERLVQLDLTGESDEGDGRVVDGLLALYDFEQGFDQVVPDVSGVAPALDLEIQHPGAVQWLPGALDVKSPTIIRSAGPAQKITEACAASGGITLEAWIRPDNLQQEGPARVLTLSDGSSLRNFTLGQGLWGGQPSDTYNVRLRTTQTDLDGMPMVTTGAGAASTSLQHVVYTRDPSGLARIYVDGVQVGDDGIGGSMSNWDGYKLALANEFGTERPWLGSLHLVAVYGRALSGGEVDQNFESGPGDEEHGYLEVDPPSDLVVYATEGEQLPETSKVYTLSNTGGEPIDWQVSVSEPWAFVDLTSGVLLGGADQEVRVELDEGQLATFSPGVHSALVEFLNPTNGLGETNRQVTVIIEEEGGEVSYDFFVDAATGDDSNNGSAGSPWRTVQRALSAAPAGSVVGVHAGEYDLSETSPKGRNAYLTLMAMPGPRPVLDGVYVNYPSLANAFLRVEGFEVYSGSKSNLVYLRNGRFIDIVDCVVHAQKWAKAGKGVDAFEVLQCEDVLIQDNRVYEINRGVTTSGTARLTIRHNYIRPKAGSSVQYAGDCEDGVIEFNHIQGQSYIPYPADEDAVQGPHASVISVRSGDLTIRGNHMHGMGNSSGIMFYQPDAAGGEAAYSNILLENNALYDLDNTYALRINNLGTNVVLRNNLIFPRLRVGTCNGGSADERYRYSNALVVHSVADGHSGAGLELYNNILIGIVSVPDEAQELNNVVWAWGPSPWLSVSPSGTSHIESYSYQGCGNHSSFFESGFFENTPDYSFPSKDPADWTLAPGSLGHNFGDFTVQPPTSLGSIGPDGFLLDDGPLRSPTVHSAGPFERKF